MLGIGTNFAQWDTVTLSGVAQVIRDNIGTDLEDDKIIYVQQADSVVVPISGWEKATYHWAKYVQTSSGVQRTTADGKTEMVESSTQSQVKLERTAPDMDYLCENDNRVWDVPAARTSSMPASWETQPTGSPIAALRRIPTR